MNFSTDSRKGEDLRGERRSFPGKRHAKPEQKRRGHSMRQQRRQYPTWAQETECNTLTTFIGESSHDNLI